MRNATRASLFIFLLGAVSSIGLSQLRNLSQFERDCLNRKGTYFILRDGGEAEFGWASEWTHITSNANDGKAAIVVWHFKDGSKAYSLQAENIGEIGMNSGYFLTAKSSNLEDVHRKKIQPLTKTNFPIKVELWIGALDNESGYSFDLFGDVLCFNEAKIEQNRTYQFTDCPK
jgi:hypothetical protein